MKEDDTYIEATRILRKHIALVKLAKMAYGIPVDEKIKDRTEKVSIEEKLKNMCRRLERKGLEPQFDAWAIKAINKNLPVGFKVYSDREYKVINEKQERKVLA